MRRFQGMAGDNLLLFYLLSKTVQSLLEREPSDLCDHVSSCGLDDSSCGVHFDSERWNFGAPGHQPITFRSPEGSSGLVQAWSWPLSGLLGEFRELRMMPFLWRLWKGRAPSLGRGRIGRGLSGLKSGPFLIAYCELPLR